MSDKLTRYTGDPSELDRHTRTHSADMAAMIAAGHSAIRDEIAPPETQVVEAASAAPDFDWPESPIGKPGDGFPETGPRGPR